MFGPVELRNNTLVVSSKRVADDFNKNINMYWIV